MIQFTSVSKSYGSVRALHDVSFTVERGEVFGYIGPNGAGKTTTIKILTGLVRDYQGTVLVEGTPIEQDRSSFHRRVGYLPQVAGFQEWRTVRHALETFGLLSGITHAELPNRIGAVSERLALTEHLDRRIVHLSGGMQQRLRFAQAIIHQPEIIILDEPLSGLDAASRAELKRTIRELASAEHTIMLSSHVLADVEDLADRIAILDHGQIQTFGTREELRARHRVGTRIEVTGDGVETGLGDLAGEAWVERLEKADATRANGHVARAGSPVAPGAAGRRIVFHVRAEVSFEEAMHELLRTIVDRGVQVQSIRNLEPTLEEVYLSLTEASHE